MEVIGLFLLFCSLTSGSRLCSQVVINLGLVYKVQHHCGVIFQFVAFVRKRKRTVPDIVAAGGRYDHLVGFLCVRCDGISGGRTCFYSDFKCRLISVILGKTLSYNALWWWVGPEIDC